MTTIRFHRVVFTLAVMLLLLARPAVTLATTVRLATSFGAIDIVLYDAATPLTVANFLTYVNSGAYGSSFVHRSVPRFVIQGGGYVWDDATNSAVAVPAKPPVPNEFSASRSNRRGTIAMAKLGGDPNSATSQWFINLADNSANLDNQNGGFTVFGEVTTSSMAVVDAIAALQLVNAGSPFDSLPIVGTIASGAIRKQNLVIVSDARVVSTNSVDAGQWVQKAYVAYYGRPADPDGQAYWANRMDSEGGSLGSIIGAFGNSDEFTRRYGGLTNTQLVTKIYQQTLGRDPDRGGLDWYVAEIEAGRRTLQTITLDVLNGATTAPDSAVVANKLDVAEYYTVKVAVGCVYGTEQDGVNSLSGVTASSATVTAAKAGISSRCGP
jgi:cyclophilin family peptidyl-prolyl cis-trans isomerase